MVAWGRAGAGGPPGDGDRGRAADRDADLRLDGTEVVVAVSGQPFPMPAGAQGVSSGGMA